MKSSLRIMHVFLGIVAVSGIVGCSPAPEVTIPPQTALEKYSSILDEVIEAITEEVPAVIWRESGPAALTPQEDGTCSLKTVEYISDQDLYIESDKYQRVAATVNPILLKHGFEKLGEPEFKEAIISLDSKDESNANISI